MPRKKTTYFIEPKMLSSRIEKEDYEKISTLLKKENKTVQDFLNDTVRLFISGNIIYSDGELKNEQ